MEIKPCPFCQTTASLIVDNFYSVRCDANYPECGVRGPSRTDHEAAIEAWNAWGVKTQPAGTSSGTESTR